MQPVVVYVQAVLVVLCVIYDMLAVLFVQIRIIADIHHAVILHAGALIPRPVHIIVDFCVGYGAARVRRYAKSPVKPESSHGRLGVAFLFFSQACFAYKTGRRHDLMPVALVIFPVHGYPGSGLAYAANHYKLLRLCGGRQRRNPCGRQRFFGRSGFSRSGQKHQHSQRRYAKRMHPFHVSVTSFKKHFLYSIWYLIRYIFYLLPGITFGILLGFLFDILFCFQFCFLYAVLLFFPSEADSPKLAGRLAVAAGNALTVSHFSDIHFTGPQAGIAVHALAFVQLDGKQRDSVKQAIERA